MDWKLKIEQLILSKHFFNKSVASRVNYCNNGLDGSIKLHKRQPLGGKIIAAYGNSFVLQSFRCKNDLFYYPNYFSLIRKRIKLSTKEFSGLISGSNIEQVMLLPYLRDLGQGRSIKQLRIVIVTDKCQVFHNYPARSKDCDGPISYGDDVRFEESAIWDMPGRKYPTKNDTPLPTERYFPYLPETAYEYHPCLCFTEKTRAAKGHNRRFYGSFD